MSEQQTFLDEILNIVNGSLNCNDAIPAIKVQYRDEENNGYNAYTLSDDLMPKDGRPVRIVLDNDCVIYALPAQRIFVIDGDTNFPQNYPIGTTLVYMHNLLFNGYTPDEFESIFKPYKQTKQINTLEDLFTSDFISGELKNKIGEWFNEDRKKQKAKLIDEIQSKTYITIPFAELNKLEPEQLRSILKYYESIHSVLEGVASGVEKLSSVDH